LAVTAGGRKMATLKVTPEPVEACTDESIGGQEPSVAVADCDGVSRGVACCVFDGDAGWEVLGWALKTARRPGRVNQSAKAAV